MLFSHPDQVVLFSTSGFGKTLSGHVISSIYAAHSLRCMELCLTTKDCKSFNYSGSKRICEMNSSTAKKHKNGYRESKDFDYYEALQHTVIGE